MPTTEKEKSPEEIVADLVEAKSEEKLEKKLAELRDKTFGKVLFEGGAPGTIPSAEDVKKEISAARWVKTLAAAEGDKRLAFEIAKVLHPHDKVLMDSYEKALGSTVLTDGGSLIPSVLAQEIILPLYTRIARTKLGGRRVPMPNGNITIPRMDVSSTVGWVGENLPGPKTQPKFGDVKMTSKKAFALVVVSNDLLRSSSLAADQFILDDLRNKLQILLDFTMLYGPGTEFAPSGLDRLLPASQKLGDADTPFTTKVISTLWGLLGQANVPLLKPGIVFNAITESYLMNLTTTTGAFLFYDEMVNRGTIRGIPYAISNNAKYTPGAEGDPGVVEIFIGDWAELFIGEQLDLQLEMTRDGAYESGGQTFSTFSRDQTAIRVISLMDFNVRHVPSFIKGTYKLAEE